MKRLTAWSDWVEDATLTVDTVRSPKFFSPIKGLFFRARAVGGQAKFIIIGRAEQS